MKDNQLIKGVMHTMMLVVALMLGSSQHVYAAVTLHEALVFDLFCGNTERILQLLANENCDSDVKKIEEERGSLLIRVVRLEGVDELELVNLIVQLVAHGADVNKQDSGGDTPLHYAVRRNSVELVRALLYRGADPNLLNNLRSTPLHLACSYGHFDLVQLLVNDTRVGIDFTLRNTVGTAYELAAKKGYNDIVDFIKGKLPDGKVSRNHCFLQ